MHFIKACITVSYYYRLIKCRINTKKIKNLCLRFNLLDNMAELMEGNTFLNKMYYHNNLCFDNIKYCCFSKKYVEFLYRYYSVNVHFYILYHLIFTFTQDFHIYFNLNRNRLREVVWFSFFHVILRYVQALYLFTYLPMYLHTWLYTHTLGNNLKQKKLI